jgi:hypothetical protein
MNLTGEGGDSHVAFCAYSSTPNVQFYPTLVCTRLLLRTATPFVVQSKVLGQPTDSASSLTSVFLHLNKLC